MSTRHPAGLCHWAWGRPSRLPGSSLSHWQAAFQRWRCLRAICQYFGPCLACDTPISHWHRPSHIMLSLAPVHHQVESWPGTGSCATVPPLVGFNLPLCFPKFTRRYLSLRVDTPSPYPSLSGICACPLLAAFSHCGTPRSSCSLAK